MSGWQIWSAFRPRSATDVYLQLAANASHKSVSHSREQEADHFSSYCALRTLLGSLAIQDFQFNLQGYHIPTVPVNESGSPPLSGFMALCKDHGKEFRCGGPKMASGDVPVQATPGFLFTWTVVSFRLYATELAEPHFWAVLYSSRVQPSGDCCCHIPANLGAIATHLAHPANSVPRFSFHEGLAPEPVLNSTWQKLISPVRSRQNVSPVWDDEFFLDLSWELSARFGTVNFPSNASYWNVLANYERTQAIFISSLI